MILNPLFGISLEVLLYSNRAIHRNPSSEIGGGGCLVGGFYFRGEDLMYASQVDGDWVNGGDLMDGDQYLRDGNIVDGS